MLVYYDLVSEVSVRVGHPNTHYWTPEKTCLHCKHTSAASWVSLGQEGLHVPIWWKEVTALELTFFLSKARRYWKNRGCFIVSWQPWTEGKITVAIRHLGRSKVAKADLIQSGAPHFYPSSV